MIKKLLLLSFLASFAAMAQPSKGKESKCNQGPMAHGGGWMMENSLWVDMAKELNLPVGQVQKLEQMAMQARQASAPLKEALQEAQEALKEALAQPSAREEALMERLSAVSAAKLELQKSHMRFMLALRQELGPELWEKLRDKKLQKKGKKGKRGSWKGTCMEGECPAAQ